MPYQTEMDFLRRVLSKCRLQMCLLDLNAETEPEMDLGLRRLLGREEEYSSFFEIFRRAEENMIYRMEDQFLCSYMFLLLPGNREEKVLLFGPYFRKEPVRESLLQEGAKLGSSAEILRQMENYCSAVPVLPDGNAVFAAIETFAECLWGGSEAYRLTDINMDLYAAPHQMSREGDALGAEEVRWIMENMEQRYAAENEMMQAVSQGLTQKAELLLSGFSSFAFERRLTDPVRNLKNYCIVMNTLLRKAAESGGVHPLYLDRISSSFAGKIEALTEVETVSRLMEEMFRAYCRLVNKHTTRHYSPPVQKAVIQIDMDPGGDLGLAQLARLQGLNASYLSSLFRKETGETVTEYINRKRMKAAMHLLAATPLQVQTVAQRCGIADVNYFSKLFKKHTGKTPKEYRQMVKSQLLTKDGI